jgi:hypothetical protein
VTTQLLKQVADAEADVGASTVTAPIAKVNMPASLTRRFMSLSLASSCLVGDRATMVVAACAPQSARGRL